MPKIDTTTSEYEDYLATEHWHDKRDEIQKRDNYRCVFCSDTHNLAVHHVTYDNIGIERPEDLITVCRTCHAVLTKLHETAPARRAEIAKTRNSLLRMPRLALCGAFNNFVWESLKHEYEPLTPEAMRGFRASFCETLQIEQEMVSATSAQGYVSARRKYRIDAELKKGVRTVDEIADKLNVPKSAVRKRIKEIEEIGAKMPKINKAEYEAAQASTGDYQRMPAGGYVAQIQAVRTDGPASYGSARVDYVNAKQYVKLIYDIAEGDFAGRFSDDYWTGENKDYGHQIFLSWKNMGAFKGNIQALDESNPGFDALAAFEADRWELFIGKKVGIVVGEEEYEANDGEIKTRLGLPRLKSVQDVRAGKFRVPEKKTVRRDTQGYSAPPAATGNGASVYDEDCPF